MTEEELKLKIEYLEDEIQRLELRLQNAMTYIDIILKEKKDERVG